MAPATAREQYPLEIAAVTDFFRRYYGDDVVTSDEFDEEVDEEVVLFRVGKNLRIVAVAPDFLELGVADITEKLAAWNVAHLSRTLERRCRLKLTCEGPQEERD